MLRELIVDCYRRRIEDDADIKLYQDELESLLLCFIDQLAQIPPKAIKQIEALYADEISMLSENFSPELINRKFLPEYHKIVNTAVSDGYLDPIRNISKDTLTSILLESSGVQSRILSTIAARSYEMTILKKVRLVSFTLWGGVEFITTGQVAEFYNVPVTRVQTTLRSHYDEFNSDGVKMLLDRELADAILKFKIASRTFSLVIWNPRSVVRLGFLLRNSDVAKALRTVSLDFIEKAPPKSSVELLLTYQEIIGEEKKLDVVEQQDVALIDEPSWPSVLSSVKQNKLHNRLDDWSQATDAAHQDAWRTVLLSHCG